MGLSPYAHADLVGYRRRLATPRPRGVTTALEQGLHGHGRDAAAIVLAIVSAKPAEHFTSSPGGYFYGMVAKAKVGELNLARTVWGLRLGGRREGEGHAPRRRT